MFRLVDGLRNAILSLMRREDEEELNAPSLASPTIAPEMLTHRGQATPSTESSVTSSAPSHLSIAVDGENNEDTHPGEDWIKFIPEVHRTGTLIPISEAYPEERVLARYIRFHVDTLTRRYTRGKRHDQNLRVREAISQPVRRCRCACARYRTRFRPNKFDRR